MAKQTNPSFLVERKEPVLIQSLQPTPTPILSLSTIDNDPNLEFLCQTIHVYRCSHSDNGDADDHDNGTSAYVNHRHDSNPPDPAAVIQEALSKALVYYYPLAGKLKRHDDGKLRLSCTGEGVPFVVAKANCSLDSLHHLDGVDVDVAKNFIFEQEMAGNDSGAHPLVIQVTRFACGGFTVGMGLSHSVCDGFGSGQFFRAVGELASGKAEPTVKPVWERERLVVGCAPDGPFLLPFDRSTLATSPYLPTTDLVHESFNIDSNTIKRLKAGLINQSACDSNIMNVGDLTTLEVLGAYVWRSRCRALELNLDGRTTFSLAVGLRNVLDPPLPEGYYGNAFVATHADLVGSELSNGLLSSAVKLIKESKKRAGVEYVWPWLGILEKANQENVKIAASGATMVLTDWRHMSLFEVDFGWKESVNVIPVPWNLFGYVDLCIFLPPCTLDPSMRGGVRVLVCLPRAAITKFKKEMDFLKLGEGIV